MRLIYWSLLLFIMWLILSANLQIENILLGFGVSFSVALLYTKLFEHKEFESINIYWLFIYLLVLLKNLIISNIQIGIRILSKDMKLKPEIVSVKTELKSEWKKLLLANSITLTPGTLTLDIEDDILRIHVIECKNLDEKDKITKEFEDVISKI